MEESAEISVEPTGNTTRLTRRDLLKRGADIGKALAVAAAIGTIPSDKSVPRGPLDNWASERGLLHWREFNARTIVADAIREDSRRLSAQSILTPAESSKIVASVAGGTIQKVAQEIAAGKTLSASRKDSITGEPYTVEVLAEKQNNNIAYIARERHPDGSIISEAVLNPDGSTKLTLQFRGPRYKNANPNITEDNRFPKAAATVFKLLADSLLK